MITSPEYSSFVANLLAIWAQSGRKPAEIVITPGAAAAMTLAGIGRGGTDLRMPPDIPVRFRSVSDLEMVDSGKGTRAAIITTSVQAGLNVVTAVDLA